MSTRNETFVLWNVGDANPTLAPLFNATYGKRLVPIIAMVVIRAGRLEIVSASLIGPRHGDHGDVVDDAAGAS